MSLIDPYEIDFDLSRLFYIYFGRNKLSDRFLKDNEWLFKDKRYEDEEYTLIQNMYFKTNENALNRMQDRLKEIEKENEQLKTQRDQAYKNLESTDKAYLAALVEEMVQERLKDLEK